MRFEDQVRKEGRIGVPGAPWVYEVTKEETKETGEGGRKSFRKLRKEAEGRGTSGTKRYFLSGQTDVTIQMTKQPKEGLQDWAVGVNQGEVVPMHVTQGEEGPKVRHLGYQTPYSEMLRVRTAKGLPVWGGVIGGFYGYKNGIGETGGLTFHMGWDESRPTTWGGSYRTNMNRSGLSEWGKTASMWGWYGIPSMTEVEGNTGKKGEEENDASPFAKWPLAQMSLSSALKGGMQNGTRRWLEQWAPKTGRAKGKFLRTIGAAKRGYRWGTGACEPVLLQKVTRPVEGKHITLSTYEAQPKGLRMEGNQMAWEAKLTLHGQAVWSKILPTSVRYKAIEEEVNLLSGPVQAYMQVVKARTKKNNGKGKGFKVEKAPRFSTNHVSSKRPYLMLRSFQKLAKKQDFQVRERFGVHTLDFMRQNGSRFLPNTEMAVPSSSLTSAFWTTLDMGGMNDAEQRALRRKMGAYKHRRFRGRGRRVLARIARYPLAKTNAAVSTLQQGPQAVLTKFFRGSQERAGLYMDRTTGFLAYQPRPQHDYPTMAKVGWLDKHSLRTASVQKLQRPGTLFAFFGVEKMGSNLYRGWSPTVIRTSNRSM